MHKYIKNNYRYNGSLYYCDDYDSIKHKLWFVLAIHDGTLLCFVDNVVIIKTFGSSVFQKLRANVRLIEL